MTSQPDPRTWQRPASASLVDPEDDLPTSNYAGDFETTAIPRYDTAKSSTGEPFGLISDPEPLPEGHVLFKLQNAVVSPHIGGQSPESADRAWRLFRENIRRFAAGEPLLCVVDKAKGY